MHDPAAEATVFVIDDDARMRAAMERLLKSVGLRAESFATPQDFLRRNPQTVRVAWFWTYVFLE